MIGEGDNILYNFKHLYAYETQNIFTVCTISLVYSGSLPCFYHSLSFEMKYSFFYYYY